ncbi:HNH endonuclease signature motif containing protein [Frankia sp. R82]|uniref:HNH endonuclease n=1 Tax=Frankia sp. R82 TaxID=2950553 RepID=UPI0020431278|nr:HNH endonuclease signature motif containing protein [Frankia sp. R82]MCM3884058.1 HNH endonuclease [Frankia sp. R82]
MTHTPSSTATFPTSDFDPDLAPLDEVVQTLRRWSVRLAAATHTWLTTIAAFDRRNGWDGLGVRSCAHWLALHCSLDLRTAREQLATAHALTRLPAVNAAAAAGQLSYSKLRAIARVATPANEAAWLQHAFKNTASRLERLVSRHRQQTADPAKLRDARALSLEPTRDGNIRLTATLSPDDAAVLVTAINAALRSLGTDEEEAPAGPPTDGELVHAPRMRARDADALIALAEAFLHHDAPALQDSPHTLTIHFTAPGRGTAESRQEDPPTTPDDDEVREEGVREEEQGSARSRFPAATAAVLGWGIGLPPAMVSRLGCDSMIRALVSDLHDNPLHLGRRHRLPTRRLRDAVYIRDQGICQFPSCEHTRWLHIHHCNEWHADHGETNVESLLLVCGAHHRAIHDLGLVVHRHHDGTITVRAANGQSLRSDPPSSPSAPTFTDLDALILHNDADDRP